MDVSNRIGYRRLVLSEPTFDYSRIGSLLQIAEVGIRQSLAATGYSREPNSFAAIAYGQAHGPPRRGGLVDLGRTECRDQRVGFFRTEF